MSYDRSPRREGGPLTGSLVHRALDPGKRTLTEALPVKGQGGNVDPDAAFTQATGGPAAALPFRAELEQQFGQDFSGVSAHTGRAAEMASIGALAATRNEQIAFASDQPDKATVAHELAHVVQNRQAGSGGAVQGRGGLSDPGSAAEVEAESIGQRAAAGESVRVAAAPGGEVQRALLDDVRTTLREAGPQLPAATASLIFNQMRHVAVDAEFIGLVQGLPQPQLTGVLGHLCALGQTNDGTTLRFACALPARPAFVGEVRAWLALTTQQADALLKLHANGYLDAVLTNVLVDGALLAPVQAAFPVGGALSPAQRAVLKKMAALTTTLATLKELVAIRFNIPVGQIDALPAGQRDASNNVIAVPTDWDVAGLKQAYMTMNDLPDGHAADNAQFQRLRRYTGGSGSGWHGQNDTIALGYDTNQLGSTFADTRSVMDRVRQVPPAVFAGKNVFDQVVRHEVGHAVDAKVGVRGSAGYCINNAHGGNWTVYNNRQDLIGAVFAATNGPLQQAGLIDDRGKAFIDLGSTAQEMKDFFTMGQGADVRWTGMNAQQQQAALADQAFTILASDLEAPWKNGGGTPVGGRVFVKTNDTKWGRFDNAARARAVSEYQFRSPEEWFAEAYAAYFQPNGGNPAEHGDRLRAKDATTYTHIHDNLDQAI